MLILYLSLRKSRLFWNHLKRFSPFFILFLLNSKRINNEIRSRNCYLFFPFHIIIFSFFSFSFLISIINYNTENKTLIRYLVVIVCTKQFRKFINDSNSTIVFIVPLFIAVYYSLRYRWSQKQCKLERKWGRFVVFNEIRGRYLSPSEKFFPRIKGNKIGIVEKRRIYLGSRSNKVHERKRSLFEL